MNLIFADRLSAALALAVVTLSAVGCSRSNDEPVYANLAAAEKIRVALGGEAGAVEEVAATGTGWATLKGKFTFDGDPPTMPPYGVNKDQATCAPGGQAPLQQYLLVDPASKGIANVVVFARKASRVHEGSGPKTDSILFDQKVCLFLTHVQGMTTGQTFDIRNSDNVGHNTNISGQNGFNQTIASGATTPFLVKKEEAAPVPVRCSIHPWMLAYLLPRSNAYFAVTAEDGSFEIPNLPAGEKLEIQVWHENAAGGNGALFVNTPEGKKLNWSNKGRFIVTLEENEERDLPIVVPAAAFGG
ncbi:hypothetical protein [Lacipirellula parvula]|uniref:Uncharacterized protein n=1 Tax=Lacipirellula parvula TaxID=2650471 RepID=A0A5K7XP12_9BACT|nr:hypothetical protein [Lacipirellula parvula]BBO35029.1 hypothetical protein PLANPX_4641 [Lacipirellula parvula]